MKGITFTCFINVQALHSTQGIIFKLTLLFLCLLYVPNFLGNQ